MVWRGRDTKQPPNSSTGTRERSREARRRRLVIANTPTEVYKWWRGRTRVTVNRSTRDDTRRVNRAGIKMRFDIMLSVKRPLTRPARGSGHEELPVVLAMSVLFIVVSGKLVVSVGAGRRSCREEYQYEIQTESNSLTRHCCRRGAYRS